MSKRIEVIDIIDSSTTADISVVKKMDYGVSRDESEYGDTEVPDMGAVRQIASSTILGPAIVTSIVGGVTVNPITVDHSPMVWPTVLLRQSDGTIYTGATSVDDGTNIILTGDSDGAGHFVDTFTFIIKP